MSYSGNGLIDRAGAVGDLTKVQKRKRKPTQRILSRKRFTALAIAAAATALLALVVIPAERSTATPTREGGNCSTCHPYRTTGFLTVSNLPTGTYTPNSVYIVTITLADTNGATGQNSFDLILSAGGGSLTTTDPNAEINSPTEASANDLVSPMTVSTWTVRWTAPSSGSVTITTWSVMSMTGAIGQNAPYDKNTVTLTAGAAIPEFPTLLVPVVGIVAAIVVVAKISRSK